MYPTHGELIEFLHLLGYPNYQEGICFGISAMTVSPILACSTESANERFKKIKVILDEYRQMCLDCGDEDRVPCSLRHYMDITLEIDEKIDILAYCEGVAIYFYPKDYKVCFPKETPLYQDLLLVNALIQSIEIENKNGLAGAGSAMGYYNVQSKKLNARDHFLTLKDTIFKLELNISIVCVMISNEHAIPLGYSAKKEQWCYCIINNGGLQYIYTNDTENIINFIETEFFRNTEKGLVIATQMYCLNEDKEKTILLKDTYQNALRLNGLANLTLKGDDGFTILDYAIGFEESKIIEHLLAQPLLELTPALDYFLEKQEFNSRFQLPPAIQVGLNNKLNTHEISPEYKVYLLKLYIILREDEFRKSNREQYNSALARFFQYPGSNARAKLNAATALLKGEANLERRAALKFGRLGKIAALFLNNTPFNSPRAGI